MIINDGIIYVYAPFIINEAKKIGFRRLVSKIKGIFVPSRLKMCIEITIKSTPNPCKRAIPSFSVHTVIVFPTNKTIVISVLGIFSHYYVYENIYVNVNCLNLKVRRADTGVVRLRGFPLASRSFRHMDDEGKFSLSSAPFVNAPYILKSSWEKVDVKRCKNPAQYALEIFTIIVLTRNKFLFSLCVFVNSALIYWYKKWC